MSHENAILPVEKFDGPESRGGERARVVRLHEWDEARLKGSGVPTGRVLISSAFPAGSAGLLSDAPLGRAFLRRFAANICKL